MPRKGAHQRFEDYLDEEESLIPGFIEVVIDDPQAAQETEKIARHYMAKVRQDCQGVLPEFISFSSYRQIRKAMRELWLEFYRKALKDSAGYPTEVDFVRALNRDKMRGISDLAHQIVNGL